MVTYFVRVRNPLGSGYEDLLPPRTVTLGQGQPRGSTLATGVIDVPCDVDNGALTLVVTATDGAGNTRLEGPVESNRWVRDTQAPVTVASLAHLTPFRFVPAANVSVTNSTMIPVTLGRLGSTEEAVRAFQVVVTPDPVKHMFNVTGGDVGVPVPAGPVNLTVVRTPRCARSRALGLGVCACWTVESLSCGCSVHCSLACIASSLIH